MHVYSSSEVSLMLGLSRQRLDYWARTKLLVPSVRDAHGKGTRRLYSLDDLVLLQFIKRLLALHWSTQKIRRATTRLQTFLAGSEEIVLLDGRDTILALVRTRKGEQVLLDTLDPGGQQVLEIVLETLVQETRYVAERFASEVVEHE